MIWMWAAGLAFPWLLYFDLSNGKEPSPLVFCVESWPSQVHGNIYFVLVNLGLFYLVPLSFISFGHLIIWLRVRHPQELASASVTGRQLARTRAKTSVQKLVIVIVVGFAVCWLPLYVIFVRVKLIPVKLGATEEKVLDYALPIAQWLGAANSCINPILYVFFNVNFRIALRRFLRGSECTTPENCPSPHHNRMNQVALPRWSFLRLMIAFRRSRSKKNQLKNFRHDAISSEESNVINFHQKNQKLPAIKRTQTYKAAIGNSWTCNAIT